MCLSYKGLCPEHAEPNADATQMSTRWSQGQVHRDVLTSSDGSGSERTTTAARVGVSPASGCVAKDTGVHAAWLNSHTAQGQVSWAVFLENREVFYFGREQLEQLSGCLMFWFCSKCWFHGIFQFRKKYQAGHSQRNHKAEHQQSVHRIKPCCKIFYTFQFILIIFGEADFTW